MNKVTNLFGRHAEASGTTTALPQIVSPDNRLPLTNVMATLINKKAMPRQPHDHVDDLVTESIIARSIFHSNILPLLIDILPPVSIKVGEPKSLERVADKVAQKLKLNAERIDEYKSSGCIHYGLNCDYFRDSQTVKDMDAIKLATQLFQGRGILTLDKKDGSAPIQIILMDVENGYVEEVSHKPKLRRINLKIAVPLELNDGSQTFHVLEHKIFLAESAENEEAGMKAWAKYRTLSGESSRLQASFDKARSGSAEAEDILNEFLKISAEQERTQKERIETNSRDEEIEGINSLQGFAPDTTEGQIKDLSWKFESLECYLSKQLNTQATMKAQTQSHCAIKFA